MIEDILTITKYFVLFIISFYGYIKLSKIKLKLMNLLDSLIAVLFAVGLYFATKQLRSLRPIGFFIFTFLYEFIRYRQTIIHTAVISVISCGLAIINMAVAFIISIPINYLIFLISKDETIRNCVATIITSAFQLLFIFFIYKIRRFKSGISIQENNGSIDLLLLISVFCIFLMTLFYTDNITSSPTEIILITLIFCGLGFIIWWKKYVTNKYHTQIYKRNETLYEEHIKEYKNENNNLLNQNAELSKIIHRDNKLIPAMVMAVKELIINAPNNTKLKGLLNQLEDLSAEHQEVIENYQAKSDLLPKTNIIPIDAVLHFILSKSKQYNIEFNVTISNDSISELLSKITDVTDLTTILCDLGENAIIATKSITEGKILIAFDKSESNEPCIYFYDNGHPFDEKVISNMGKRKITTHKNDGGSGIGLMTLFEILNKYNASYRLDERQQNEFTKCIQLTFDNLHNLTFSR